MRFFIALEVPEENRLELEQVQKKLEQLIPQVKLTDYKKLHLTIAFIGEHPESLKAGLVDVINRASVGTDPFAVTPSYIDAFPKLHQPQTFWVGVKGDVDKLFLLQERIKDGLIKLKLEVDNRRYFPHIAVAKVSDIEISTQLEEELEAIMTEHPFSPIQINSIKLFESIPSQGEHKHNTLADIRLS